MLALNIGLALNIFEDSTMAPAKCYFPNQKMLQVFCSLLMCGGLL